MTSEDKNLRVLFAIGSIIVAAIICILLFSSDSINSQKPKIGFIILGDINEKGWNASHYNGIKAACDDLDLELLVKDHVAENSGQCPQAIEELVAKGAGLIVLASFDYASEALPLMNKYRNISFINTSTIEEARNLTSCFARMYQGRYMSGALAGMKTKSNVIGYVAAIPNSEVCRGINAFTMGVQRVNPDARVLVMWTGNWQNEEVEAEHAEILIKKYGADILTYHQDEDAVGRVAEKFGVDFIGYNALLEGYSDHYLTSVICHWNLYYEDVLQRYVKGELVSIRNNWIGVQQGAIELSAFSNAVTPQMQSTLNFMRREIIDNRNLIFYNEIYDNEGNLRCEKDQVISDKDLLKNINWLVKGVEVVE